MRRENNVDTDLPIVEDVPWYAVPWRTFIAGNRKLWEAGRSVLIPSIILPYILVLTILPLTFSPIADTSGAPCDTAPTEYTR